jgi:hypothetical protein
MLVALKNIGTADKWRKEIVGTPTYFAAALLSWRYSESSIAGSFLILVCFLMIYSYTYEFVFPKFESRNKRVKLAIFFCAQLAFWAIVFILWSGARNRVGL